MKAPMDMAVVAAEHYEDAYEALLHSYSAVTTLLVAALQQVGPLTLPASFEARAQPFVVVIDPLPDGGVQLTLMPREETGRNVSEDAAAMQSKFEAQYERRES